MDDLDKLEAAAKRIVADHGAKTVGLTQYVHPITILSLFARVRSLEVEKKEWEDNDALELNQMTNHAERAIADLAAMTARVEAAEAERDAYKNEAFEWGNAYAKLSKMHDAEVARAEQAEAALATAQDEALEEAATEAERYDDDEGKNIARAIRKLKAEP